MAQETLSNTPYEKEWQEIDSLVQNGLVRSAKEALLRFRLKTKKEKQTAHDIKALLYLTQMNTQLKESGDWKAILQMEEELQEATVVQRPILSSLLAEMYFNYYQRHRWQLRNRTAIAEAPSRDETTWTAGDFLQRSTDLYLHSLTSAEMKTQTLSTFNAMVRGGVNSDGLYTFIYELLLDRAINHFSKQDAFLNEPAYESAFDDVKLLASLAEFTAIIWPATKQKTSSQHLIEILQDALNWKSSQDAFKKTPALLDLDLRRLKIVYEQMQTSAKEKAYRESLNTLLLQYEDTELAQLPMILWAQMDYWYQRGRNYKLGNSSAENLRWAWQKARNIGLDIQARFPKSMEARQAAFVQTNIERKSLTISLEAVQLPNEYGLLSIEYRNIDELHFRLYATTPEVYQNKNDNQKIQAQILADSPLQQWRERLPDAGDFRVHRTESSFEGLPAGVYCLLVSHGRDFSMEKENPMSSIYFWVSELGLLTQINRRTASRILVVNRRTGAPVEGANIHVWTVNNERRSTEKTASYTSDQNGMVTLNKGNRSVVRIEVTKGEDRIFPIRNYWLRGYYGNQAVKPKEKTHFFLDRGLYRPGQTLYFKTLVTTKPKEDAFPQLVAGKTFTITLYDANRQKIQEQEVTTNAFGSAAGSFTLPAASLLGRMSIQTNLGAKNRHYFQVEAYKRPRFEAILDTLEGEARLGDTIHIQGQATAYSGPAIADAEAVYTISRSSYYPWYHRGRSLYAAEEQTIAQGKTRTDANGRFELQFKALPDASLQSDRLLSYRFTIKVDIIDISGETRSTTKTIQIAKYPLNLQLELTPEHDRNEELLFKLASSNLDGKAVRINGHLSIERLYVPEKEWIKRYWPFPDTFIMKKALFEKRFPRYLYEKVENPTEQVVLGTVWHKEVLLDGDLTLRIAAGDWETGHYKVRFWTQTENGDTLDIVRSFELNDWKEQQFAWGKSLKSKIEDNYLQPGDTARLYLGTNDQQHHVLTTISKNKSLFKERWLHPGDNKNFRYKIEETDRGGVFINTLFVRHNRVFKNKYPIKVPWTNKELKITYETFRSKLYPGAEEEWIIKIGGPDKDEVSAELLAAMYDESLDQIKLFQWQFDIFPASRNAGDRWDPVYFRNLTIRPQMPIVKNYAAPVSFKYPELWTFDAHLGRYYASGAGRMSADGRVPPPPPPAVYELSTETLSKEKAEVNALFSSDPNSGHEANDMPESNKKPPLKIRKDLSETAFFFPQLHTDKEGRVVLRFKTPESLTRWKLQLFAHNKELAFALSEETVVTQKELMVLPNVPRFLRQGDRVQLAVKVSNLSKKQLAGICRLELFEINTRAALNHEYGLIQKEQPFDIAAGQSGHISWTINVPEDALGMLAYRIVAVSDRFSDGEEAVLPILSNQVLLTETLPLFIRPHKKRNFELKNLIESKQGVQHQAVTLEMTTSPAWMALKALPYLQEYPFNCTEQLINRYFANTLASKLLKEIPELQSVFKQWKSDTNALKSPLVKNEDLKNVLLQETPWVLEAQSEEEQSARIALLFDLDRMAREQQLTLAKIIARQKTNGAFAWFSGGRDSWYITQYVLEQLTRLKMLTNNEETATTLTAVLNKAMAFCDREAYQYYEKIKKAGIKENVNYLSPIIAHYLYVRSHYLKEAMTEQQREAYNFWWEQANTHIMKTGLQTQALLTVAAQRSSRTAMAQRIYASLHERALHADEMGMYWQYANGYRWHQLPIETHVLLMEAFQLMGASVAEIDEMKIWLLSQKETNRWETTKATAAAVYALMMAGSDWLSADGEVALSFPAVHPKQKAAYGAKLSQAQASAEAGTGYYKARWSADEINPLMGNIRLKNNTASPVWGALYWQYFQKTDQVDAFAGSPLKVERKIYRKTATGSGFLLAELNTPPLIGDQLTVRLTIRTDRDMEFVHLKDLRASALEPVEALSGYRYQGALGFYQSTTDLATHFFFDRLPKGEYVLEYDLRVFHRGDFSGGLATLQCMYAPKFSSHSKGQRILVKE